MATGLRPDAAKKKNARHEKKNKYVPDGGKTKRPISIGIYEAGIGCRRSSGPGDL